MTSSRGVGQVRGERHPAAKLSAKFVHRLRRAGRRQGPGRFSFAAWRREARKVVHHSVSPAALSYALHGRTWRCENRLVPPVPASRAWCVLLRQAVVRRRQAELTPPPHGARRYEAPWRCRCAICRAGTRPGSAPGIAEDGDADAPMLTNRRGSVD